MSENAVTTRRDARRDTILDVAREVFFEEGYAAASMSSIAARLGGSKGTLYNYFKSKEELFETLIRETCSRFGEPVFDMLEWRDEKTLADVRSALIDFGVRFSHFLTSDIAMRTFQLVMTEARRSPDLARVFYEAGPEAGAAKVTAYVTAAKAAGLITPPDCQAAAEQLVTLFRGYLYLPFSLNQIPRPTIEQTRSEVERAVSLFIGAYGTAPGSGRPPGP